MNPQKTKINEVVICFAGDSGDGIQLTGGQFTQTSSVHGNDFATFPNFPAEIRAPKGRSHPSQMEATIESGNLLHK